MNFIRRPGRPRAGGRLKRRREADSTRENEANAAGSQYQFWQLGARPGIPQERGFSGWSGFECTEGCNRHWALMGGPLRSTICNGLAGADIVGLKNHDGKDAMRIGWADQVARDQSTVSSSELITFSHESACYLASVMAPPPLPDLQQICTM